MEHVFVVVAVAWGTQFLLSYWQLRRFHQQLSGLRRLGRCAVGMSGNRWRGRVYGVLVIDEGNRVRHAARLSGWTVFSKLQPISGLEGMPLEALLASDAPPARLGRAEWQALQHAAQFFKPQPEDPTPPIASSTLSLSDQQL